MTDGMRALQPTYLVPVAGEAWWDRENISLYTRTSPGDRSIAAAENSILLRQDLATLFDTGIFAMVPKLDQDGTLSLVTHIFSPTQDPYSNTSYHNVNLLPVSCSVECLFVCFACAVFSSLYESIWHRCRAGTSRWMRVCDPSTGTLRSGAIQKTETGRQSDSGLGEDGCPVAESLASGHRKFNGGRLKRALARVHVGVLGKGRETGEGSRIEV
jgi:hypothetical protein